MEARITVPTGDFQKSLFMPVWARALESQRTHSLLTDGEAVKIIESLDPGLLKIFQNIPEISQIGWIARCKRFDMVINDFLKRHPGGTVVNLGCGLDTTYERINHKTVLWYDLDLKNVIKLREKFIHETINRKFISSSFLDTKWFDDIVINDSVLFISSCVFAYFDQDDIKKFLISIADKFNEAELFFDVTSLRGLNIANKLIKRSGLKSVCFFKWGLENNSVLTSWNKRIKLYKTYYTFDLEELDLTSENKIFAIISDSLDVQYMVHLKIEN